MSCPLSTVLFLGWKKNHNVAVEVSRTSSNNKNTLKFSAGWDGLSKLITFYSSPSLEESEKPLGTNSDITLSARLKPIYLCCHIISVISKTSNCRKIVVVNQDLIVRKTLKKNPLALAFLFFQSNGTTSRTLATTMEWDNSHSWYRLTQKGWFEKLYVHIDIKLVWE